MTTEESAVSADFSLKTPSDPPITQAEIPSRQFERSQTRRAAKQSSQSGQQRAHRVEAQLSATKLSVLQALDKDERNRRFLWMPQPGPQTIATVIDVDELLYGGARGGGKTSLLLGRFLGQAVTFGIHARGVIFRRTYKQLDEIVHQGKMIFCRGPKREHIARWNKAEYTFEFSNGATLRLRHLESLSDCENFQGQSISYMGFDEIVTFRDFQMYLTLLACMRSTHSKLRPIVVSTANPGGRLHNEVKKYFHIDEYPHGGRVLRNKEGRTRVYIRSLLQDNEYLRGTSYEKVLRGIKDPLRRRAWLLGDWSVSLGSFFGDLWEPKKHIFKASDLPPKHWLRFRSMDWGSAKPYAVLWWTLSDGETRYAGRIWPKDTIMVYRELYGGDPDEEDTGLRETVTEVAEKIRLIEVRERDALVQAGPADTAMWQSPDGGPSIGERFAQCKVPFVKAHKQRKIGWEQIRIRLRGFDTPTLVIRDKCTHLIKTLPILSRDEKDWEDIDSDQNDHLADTLRYVAMSRMVAAPTEEQRLDRQKAEANQRKTLDRRYSG